MPGLNCLSSRERKELRLELEIRAAPKRIRQMYGPARLQRVLADNGVNKNDFYIIS